MILLADDTSILITGSNSTDLDANMYQTFITINNWFNINSLTLNLNKTQFLEFKTTNLMTKNFQQITVNATEVRFLGLTLDNTLSWNKHIDQLAAKLSSACYALRKIKLLLPQDTLKIIYFACIHSLLSYGIICWGNSTHAKKAFIIQKKKH